MIMLAVLWFIQDFTQVFAMGLLIVPDIFLLCVIFYTLRPEAKPDRYGLLIWVAFIGGLLWDLRWTNLPGLTAALNGAIVAVSCIAWRRYPVQARSWGLFAAVLTVAMIISGVTHFLFWTMPSQAALRQLAVQQLVGIPIIVLISFIFWQVSDRHV